MFYSDNLTNRELVISAMPLQSLSRLQWNTLLAYMEQVEAEDGADSTLYMLLETLRVNQARIEVISDYFDHFSEKLDKPVREDSVGGFQIM